jgi:hypothetical protein
VNILLLGMYYFAAYLLVHRLNVSRRPGGLVGVRNRKLDEMRSYICDTFNKRITSNNPLTA